MLTTAVKVSHDCGKSVNSGRQSFTADVAIHQVIGGGACRGLGVRDFHSGDCSGHICRGGTAVPVVRRISLPHDL
jgi:hypothetical protein